MENRLIDNFRKTIFSTIRSIILELKETIICLTEEFPLKASVNAVNYNLAFLSESELHCHLETSSASTDNLQVMNFEIIFEISTFVSFLSEILFQKIKYVFILLQSEFLRQLCLCFTTSLWTRNCYKSINDVFRRLVDFNSKYTRLYTNLKSAFDVHYLHKSLPRENRRDDIDSNWLYAEAYLKLCSVSSNLRSVLSESRSLEEYLEQIKISNNVSNDAVNLLDRRSDEILAKYVQCAPVIDDFCKCIARLRPKQCERIEPTSPLVENHTTTNQKSILLGVTDFSPNGPDEVFVGVSESIKQTDERDTDVADVVTQTCSKLLINELKVALKDKAKEWKERERAALQRKNEDCCDAEMLDDFETNDDEIPSRKERKRVHFEPTDIPSNAIPVTESSFAKQIAAVSASWGLQEEEFFDYEQEEEFTDHEQEDENS